MFIRGLKNIKSENQTNIAKNQNISVANDTGEDQQINNSKYALGLRTKDSDCKSNLPYPDFACSPGEGMNITMDALCKKGYTTTARNVSEDMKHQVYDEYGIVTRKTGEYEVDHIVPLELGGTNSISNLWPEPAEPMPGFHQKDLIENLLHDKVCSGDMQLNQAQYEIVHNWTRYLDEVNMTT